MSKGLPQEAMTQAFELFSMGTKLRKIRFRLKRHSKEWEKGKKLEPGCWRRSSVWADEEEKKKPMYKLKHVFGCAHTVCWVKIFSPKGKRIINERAVKSYSLNIRFNLQKLLETLLFDTI